MARSLVTISVVPSDAETIINALDSLGAKKFNTASEQSKQEGIEIRRLSQQVREQVQGQK